VKSGTERADRKAAGKQAGKNAGARPIATNRRAFHDYFIQEKLEAGLSLTGTEVKSLPKERRKIF